MRVIFSLVAAAALLAGGYCIAVPHHPGRRSRPPAPAVGGTASDEIASAQDAAFSDGVWYVADSKNGRIAVLDSAAHVRKMIGRPGRGPGELTVPHLVAASGGRVYVSELGRDGATVFDSSGRYVQRLGGSGRCGLIVQLAATDSSLFALRRCVLQDRRILFLVDVSAGDHFVAWSGADTIGTPGAALVPLTVPLIAADTQFVVFGDGGTGCIVRFRTRDGASAGRRCLDEIPRVATPDSVVRRMASKARGRLDVPAYLPRTFRIALIRSHLAAFVPDDGFRGSWRMFDWSAPSRPLPAPIGVPSTESSFLSAGGQLVVDETENGIVFRVVAASRP